MGYFSNPNFMYLQDRGNYSKKEIDKFIISAYKKGKKKVVHGNKKYVVDKEIDRIRKYKKFQEPKRNNITRAKKNTIKSNKRKSNSRKNRIQKRKSNKKNIQKRKRNRKSKRN